MTSREKILNLLAGKPVDGLVWAPRLKIWHDAHKAGDTLPEKYKGKSLIEIEIMLGAAAGSSARIGWNQRAPKPKKHIMQLQFNTVEIERKAVENKEYVIYKTPIGSVNETFSINFDAVKKGRPMQKNLTEHLIKEEKDYEIVEYIYKDMAFIPTYENYMAFESELGDHGVPILNLDKDPMYLMIENIIGYNQFFYEFYDRKKRVEHLYHILCEKFEELKEVALNSPAKIFIAASHYDCHMISPQFYDEYMKPYLKPFAVELKKRNKYLAFHADADTGGLMRKILETEIPFIDCFCSAPMVSTTFEDAVDVWGDHVVIYGGVPSILPIPSLCSDKDFKDYLAKLFKTIKSKSCRVLLGIADNVMPEADIRRVELIADMVAHF